MPVRTGTASSVNGAAASGSTSVTVPADATGVVAFFCHYLSGDGGSMSTLTLGGTPIPILVQQADGAVTDENGIGVGLLTALPGTGTQTLAWAYSAIGTRSEGGEIILVWVKDLKAGDVHRDAKVAAEVVSNVPSFSLATETTDLVLVYAEVFQSGTRTVSITNATTTFIDDSNVGNASNHCIDVGEVAPNASSTTITMGASPSHFYDTLAAISLKEAVAAEQPTFIGARHGPARI